MVIQVIIISIKICETGIDNHDLTFQTQSHERYTEQNPPFKLNTSMTKWVNTVPLSCALVHLKLWWINCRQCVAAKNTHSVTYTTCLLHSSILQFHTDNMSTWFPVACEALDMEGCSCAIKEWSWPGKQSSIMCPLHSLNKSHPGMCCSDTRSALIQVMVWWLCTKETIVWTNADFLLIHYMI